MTLRELWERAEPTVGSFLDQILAVPSVDRVYAGAARVLEALRGMKREVAKTGY